MKKLDTDTKLLIISWCDDIESGALEQAIDLAKAGLLLRIFFVGVEERANCEEDASGEHHGREDPECLRERPALPGMGELCHAPVAEGNAEQPEAHDSGLHALGGLGVGEGEPGNRDQNLA